VELDRKIVELRALGFTYSMIADELGVSVATVKSRIYRMRKRGELKPALSSSWDELATLLLQAKMRVGRVHDEMKLRHPQLTQYVGELSVAVEALRRAIELASFLKAVTTRQVKRAHAAQPNPSSEAGRSRSGAAGNRPPPPAVGSPSPSAGAKAGAQPRKRGWAFCPQCLSMYDFQGKCPACGADLVPFGTEEGRRLYLKLKRERRAG
jgi:hypothetical protein